MTAFLWEAIDYPTQITSLGKYSSLFHRRVSGRDFIFFHEGNLTSLLVLRKDGNSLVVEHAKVIESKENVGRITSNNNCILMLDDKEELFYLRGSSGDATDIVCFDNINKFLTKNADLSWHRRNQLTNCLAMTGINNSVGFLYHNELVFAALYKTIDIENGLSEFSNEPLQDFDSDRKYLLVNLEGEIANIVNNSVFKSDTCPSELLLILEPSHMTFLKPTLQGHVVSQSYSVDFQSDTLIDVLCFAKKQIILIVCKSGKIVSLKFKGGFGSFQSSHLWLPKKVCTIIGYEDENIKLLWSDLNHIHKSVIDNDNFVTNIKLVHKVRGVRHLIYAESHVLAITINCCLYWAKIQPKDDEEVMNVASSELLCKMFATGKDMEKLTEEIKQKECFIEAVEMSRNSDTCTIFEKENFIILENNSQYTFRKNFWKVLFHMKDYSNECTELRELECDVEPNSSVSFNWVGPSPHKVALVSDITNAVILVEIGFKTDQKTSQKEDQILDELRQYLVENFNFIA